MSENRAVLLFEMEEGQEIRIFAVVPKVVGNSLVREHASMLLIVEQTHSPLDVTPLLIVGQ